MELKQMRLRYAGTCTSCGAALDAGSQAYWDRERRTVTCLPCGDVPAVVVPEAGDAGGSARREYERRKVAREKRVRDRHPKLGGVFLALFDDPQSTKAWKKGAEGERRLGDMLDGLAGPQACVLHDRRIPGSRANIDIAVVPSGVYVIDAKHYTGEVRRKDVGGWLRPDDRLYVGRRDCSSLIDGAVRQFEVVRSIVEPVYRELRIVPVLCFIDAEWSLFTRPFKLRGVVVCWPRALRHLLTHKGPILPEGVTDIGATLATRLRSA